MQENLDLNVRNKSSMRRNFNNQFLVYLTIFEQDGGKRYESSETLMQQIMGNMENDVYMYKPKI